VSRRLLAPLAAAAALLAGCGLGPGSARPGNVELRVTRNFGQQQLGPVATRTKVRDSDTVLRFLESERKVTTAFGGGFVQSIDGLAGSKSAERDWFYYVNGSEASVGAADYSLARGEVIQWDYHRWEATLHVPAIVGAYPEPFVHGFNGKRLPTRVECDDPSSRPCTAVMNALSAQGVVATSAPLGSAASEQSLRVVVANWSVARGTEAAHAIELGPSASGVFARFTPAGRLELLDGGGHAAGVAPAGSGLIAATQPSGEAITWLVTGATGAGVERAAAALRPAVLRNAFAVAATPRGVERLPVGGGA
jgi:hypothetical protein